jgi:hypothetical protein
MSRPAGIKRGGFIAALATAIQVSAERCRAAVLDGKENAEMQPRQPGAVAFDEAVAVRANDVCHLERWPGSSPVQLSGPLHLVWGLDLDLVERSTRGLQMPLREMQVNGGGAEIGMSE